MGKLYIEQARIRLVDPGSLHRLVRIKGGGHDRVPTVGQSHTQRVEQQPVVVTDQQPHDATALELIAGSTICATMPPPTPGFSSNAPP